VTNLGSGVAHKLGEWKSTAICGNDITSSCLYVAALCAISAGPYAPLCLAAVAALLYLFRGIYGEVGTALPLNGGAYNALLNTTSKFKASIAACLTILSYLATAVISASEAMEYAEVLWHGLPVFWATLGLLGVFALLNVIGITESAIVALCIFVAHITTLVVLVVTSMWHIGLDFTLLVANWQTPPPSGIFHAIVFGFAAGLLGISGFESSANFIEEQKPGVFPKTLRNMWIAVAIFNPLISLLVMGMMPLSQAWHVVDGERVVRAGLLAHMGGLSAGPWFAKWVSVDAVLVLSGAVLTSYVGVTGLVRRMSLDRCMPQFLLRENRLRGTNHWIILGFLAICCSIAFIARLELPDGRVTIDVGILAGVYTLSFLGVMALFAVGNMLLKVKRRRLPRAVRASWPAVLVAFAGVLFGLAGNVLIDYPELTRLRVFVVYFAVSVLVVGLTFQRNRILRIVLLGTQAIAEQTLAVNRRIRGAILSWLEQVNRQSVIFFTKGDNLANLNRAALYVLQNEQMKRLRVVHVYGAEEEIMADHLAKQLRTLDEVYPELRIDLVIVQGQFGPELIERLSQRMGVPKNYMFIGTPGDRFPHNIAELGGVRLII
jgi:amino acid transporter